MPCHAIRSANDLNSRPSIDPLDLVDTKTLLTIGVTDSGINVMVVKNPTQARIIVYTLTTRSIDVSVRRQNNSTTTVGTALSTLIHETTGSRVGSADLDLVFLAGGWTVLVETAADALAEEHVVATVVVDHVGALDGVGAAGLEDGVVAGAGGGGDGVGGGLHFDLVDIVPERAEVHEVLATDLDEVGIDSVVGLAAVRRDTGYIMLDAEIRYDRWIDV